MSRRRARWIRALGPGLFEAGRAGIAAHSFRLHNGSAAYPSKGHWAGSGDGNAGNETRRRSEIASRRGPFCHIRSNCREGRGDSYQFTGEYLRRQQIFSWPQRPHFSCERRKRGFPWGVLDRAHHARDAVVCAHCRRYKGARECAGGVQAWFKPASMAYSSGRNAPRVSDRKSETGSSRSECFPCYKRSQSFAPYCPVSYRTSAKAV